MNRFIIFIFLLQLILCSIGSLTDSFWQAANLKDLYYLEIWTSKINSSFWENTLVLFGSWLIIFTNFVPISLLVSLEMVKFIQGILIS